MPDHLKLEVEAKARGGFYLPVRLPHEVAPLFRDWLQTHLPDRAEHTPDGSGASGGPGRRGGLLRNVSGRRDLAGIREDRGIAAAP